MNQHTEELIEIINKVTLLTEMLWVCSENVKKGITKQHLLWAGICSRNSSEKFMAIAGSETGLNPDFFAKEAKPEEFVSIKECMELCEKIITDFSLLDVTQSKLGTLYTSASEDLQETKKFIIKANETHRG